MIEFGRIAAHVSSIRNRCGFYESAPPYSIHKVRETVYSDVDLHGITLPLEVVAVVEVGVGRRAIFFNRELPHPVTRVGVAHEFGHLQIDLAAPRDLTRIECRSIPGPEQDAIERSCDHFAGELLVPFTVLEEYAPIALFPREPARMAAFLDEMRRLAETFNVSERFMEWRLRDLAQLRRSSLFMR
jgi:hypothetical protein